MQQSIQHNQPSTISGSYESGSYSSGRYDYQAIHARQQKVTWQVDDLIGGDKVLDFSKPFLPESLARTGQLGFLDGREQLILNQIRGHGYLYTFGLVEEFILPFVLDHARPSLAEDDYRTRALLEFAAEEAKHIHLFKRFREEFLNGFGSRCDVIGPPEAIARAVLSHHPLAVALTILHIEWMTQRHFTESCRDMQGMDDQFRSLLKHHWMEECQHAQLDTLMVESLAGNCSQAEVDKAVDGYLDIGGLLDGGLMQQVQFDKEALQRATGRILSQEESEQFDAVQQQAIRWTFLGSGMTHKNFRKTVLAISPQGYAKVEEVIPLFC